MNKIPKIIHQTYESKNIPGLIKNRPQSWKNLNPSFKYVFYNSNDRMNFIKNNFKPRVLQAYNKLIPGAFKADLWRYCVLYKKGGVYADIGLECLKPLESYINFNNDYFVFPMDYKLVYYNHGIYQAFLASVPQNILLKLTIDKCVDNILNEDYGSGSLDVTGPVMLGTEVFDYLEKNNINIETKFYPKPLAISMINYYQLKYAFITYKEGSYDFNGKKIKILSYDQSFIRENEYSETKLIKPKGEELSDKLRKNKSLPNYNIMYDNKQIFNPT